MKKYYLIRLFILGLSVFFNSVFAEQCQKSLGTIWNDISIDCENGFYRIKKDNKFLVPEKYRTITFTKISDNVLYIGKKNWQDNTMPQPAYLLNSNGNILYKSKSIAIDKVPARKLWIITGGSAGIINDKGNFIVPMGKYNHIQLSHEKGKYEGIRYYGYSGYYDDSNYIMVSGSSDSSDGLIDYLGNEIIPPAYHSVIPVDKHKIIVYALSNNHLSVSLLDDKQQVLIPPEKYIHIMNPMIGSDYLVVTNEDRTSSVINKDTQKVAYTLDKGKNIDFFVDDVWAIEASACYNGCARKLIDKNLKEVINMSDYQKVEPLVSHYNKLIKVTKKSEKNQS